jgi:uncharacterized protein Usg
LPRRVRCADIDDFNLHVPALQTPLHSRAVTHERLIANIDGRSPANTA